MARRKTVAQGTPSMTCQAVAPEFATEGCYCACGCGKPARVADAEPYDGTHSRRGFARNERFAGAGEQVIKGTNRAKSREFRRIAGGPR